MYNATDYSTDLSDEQWKLVRSLIPKQSRVGRPPTDRRWMINAIMYISSGVLPKT